MWSELTAAEFMDQLSSGEAEALQGASLATGQGDPLPGIIARAVDEARGYVAARPGAVLGPEGTLPPQLKASVIAIVRWRLGGRLPAGSSAIFQTENRKKENDDAVAVLKAAAKGEFVVEVPNEESGEEIGSGAEAAGFGSEAKIDF